MKDKHFAFWPPGLPRSLPPADTTLHACLEATARRFPDKPATIFQDEILSWAEIRARAHALAGYLQTVCGVRRGDRVLLDMQNGAEWVIACFAILRADAVAVPVAPMYVAAELAHYIEDSDAKVAIVEMEIASRFAGIPLEHLIVAGETPLGSHEPSPSVARPGDLCLMPYTSG